MQLLFRLTGKDFIQTGGANNALKDFEELQTYLLGLIDKVKNAEPNESNFNVAVDCGKFAVEFLNIT